MKKAMLAAAIVLAGYIGVSAALAHTAQKAAKAQVTQRQAMLNQI